AAARTWAEAGPRAGARAGRGDGAAGSGRGWRRCSRRAWALPPHERMEGEGWSNGCSQLPPLNHERVFPVNPKPNRCLSRAGPTVTVVRNTRSITVRCDRRSRRTTFEKESDRVPESRPDNRAEGAPTARQLAILEFIASQMQDRGYPPSVREIGEAVGLTSTSTVHAHLNTLQRLGLLRRDPSKPRAIEVRWDPLSGAALQRRPTTHVPLVGDVAAGTDVLAQENVEELLPLPLDFTGDGQLFMLRVRGDSMIEAGILDGDYVVARTLDGEQTKGDVVVVGILVVVATITPFTR